MQPSQNVKGLCELHEKTLTNQSAAIWRPLNFLNVIYKLNTASGRSSINSNDVKKKEKG